MCHYERGIIVLSFSDISYVIPLFVFEGFEIKFGFSFLLTHTVYIIFIYMQNALERHSAALKLTTRL